MGMYIVHLGSGMYVELVLYMETWTWLYSILHPLQPSYFLQTNINLTVYCLSKVDFGKSRDIHGHLDIKSDILINPKYS